MPKLANGKFQPLYREGDEVLVISPDPQLTYLPVMPAEKVTRDRALTRVQIGQKMVYRRLIWLPGVQDHEPYMVFECDSRDKSTGEPFKAQVLVGVAGEPMLRKVRAGSFG